jgi:HlyD family secretion protein
MKVRTLLLSALGAFVAAALLVVAFRTDPVPVDLDTVHVGPMAVTVDVDGKTRVAEIYEVAAPIRGTARRSPVRAGDEVEAGKSVVAILEPAASDPLDPRSRVQAEADIREAEASLHLARSMLRQAEEELKLAESEYRRTRELVDRSVASATSLETAENRLGIRQAAMRASVSNLERAKAALDRARAQLIEPGSPPGTAGSCCIEITAPVDGRVLDIEMISARPVDAGTRLLSIGATDQLEIVADVLSSDAVRLSVGNRAEVLRWGGPTALSAKVSTIEPAGYTKVSALGIEEQRVDVVLDIVTPIEERPTLRHGFSVFLRIVEWESDATLQVPLGALFRRGKDWAVFVAEDGKASLRTVTIGKFGRNTALVEAGLSEGETVLLHPGERIADGIAIVERRSE